MDIEELVKKHAGDWGEFVQLDVEARLRAALTEAESCMAMEHNFKMLQVEANHAIELRAYEARVQNQAERIRQLESERVPIALERTGPDWPEIWLLQGWNCSVRVAAEALRFLVENEIPTGGEAYFGYAHLLRVANDLDKTVRELLCFNAAAPQPEKEPRHE